MERKMTWEEMKCEFPDEWLLIVDYEMAPGGKKNLEKIWPQKGLLNPNPAPFQNDP